MSLTGVEGLDHSIGTTNLWLSDVASGFGTSDRRLAYRVIRAWLHGLRDRLTIEDTAHFAAQLPWLLRGVFYEGWNPSQVPGEHDCSEYVTRFARDARIRESDVAKAAAVVTAVARLHVTSGAIDEALAPLPAGLRELLEPAAARRAPRPWR